MIRPGEINKIASSESHRDTQVEKDYILGWILYGISQNIVLKKLLIFKGGTALRKLYIADYRLSEDLDFSLSLGKIDTNLLKDEFEKVIEWVKNESQLQLVIRGEKLNKMGNYSFYIGYVGPLGGNIENREIKVDISDNELLCDEIMEKPVLNEYSDLTVQHTINCYSIDEIIAEKLRSLMQRTVPRDLYDIWHLLEIEKNDLQNCAEHFKKKTEFKGKNPNEFLDIVIKKKDIYEAQWEKNLSMQFKELPQFEKVWRECLRYFKGLSEFINKI
jgi:predicted nucleotidyltransferase component of viral defense system